MAIMFNRAARGAGLQAFATALGLVCCLRSIQPCTAVPATTISPHSGTPCSKGKSGVCIDTLQQSCGGAATLTNFCPGAAHVRCCPAPGKVGAAVPVADNACTVGADAPAGTCIDTAVVDCAGAGTTSGTVATAWRACPSLPNKTRAVCTRPSCGCCSRRRCCCCCCCCRQCPCCYTSP